MRDLFEKYIKQLVETTFGFTPQIDIDFVDDTSVTVKLDGTAVEKMEMMGNGAINFHAMKQLLRVFARRNGCVSFLYIKPQDYKIKI